MCTNMGGRGSSSRMSGGVSGLSVKVQGETTNYYFTKVNGQNFYQRGVGGIPEPTPQNMSPAEFRRRVEANGAEVKTITASQRSKEEVERKADRKAANEFLDRAYASDRDMKKDSRSDARVNRANRRRRRR